MRGVAEAENAEPAAVGDEADVDEDGGGDPIVIEGTDGTDRLVGTDADETLISGGGSLDRIAGGGGATSSSSPTVPGATWSTSRMTWRTSATSWT